MASLRNRLLTWVVGLVMGGSIFLLAQTGVSFGPPMGQCHTPQACFELFFAQLNHFSPNSVTQLGSPQFFEQIMVVYKGTIWAKRARLSYGYWLKETAPQKAIPLLRTSLGEIPILNDYIQLWLGQAYAKAELWGEAAHVFQEIVYKHPGSLLNNQALYLSGEAFSMVGNCKSALPILSQALDEEPTYSKAPSALFQVAGCAEQLGQKTKAIEEFRELWWRYPMASESAQAEEWLRQELGMGFSHTMAEKYQRGLAFYRGGALKDAVKIFQDLVSSPSHFTKGLEAKYKLAMALVRLKRYEHAEKALRSISQSPSPRTDDALVWLGRVNLRMGEGLKLQKMIQALPLPGLSADQHTQLYTFYGIWLEDHRQWSKAVDAYLKAANVAYSVPKRLEALWRVGWIFYQQAEFANAIPIFLKIINETGNPKSTWALQAFSRATYWLSRTYAHLEQADQASQGLEVLKQSYPFSYYGQLAMMRLGGVESSGTPSHILASNDFHAVVPGENLRRNIHYQKIKELLPLQLLPEAVKELQSVAVEFRSDPEVFSSLVGLAGEVGAYDVGIRLAIRQFGASLRKGQLPTSSPAWASAFPMGYHAIIQDFVPKHVDPFLVGGLIREESLYSPRAVSSVGAIGLMQLMPATASRVAHQLGIQNSDDKENDLYDPQQNIRLGTHYLGQLLNEYQGNVIYAVAAYNAGPLAVKRWMTQTGHLPSDEFVEGIGYRETRGYVKRVLGNYRIYRALFGEVCRGVNLDRFC